MTFIHLFDCAGSLLLRSGFLYSGQTGAALHCGAQTSHRGGFSCGGAQALGAQASSVAARGLQQLRPGDSTMWAQ